MQLQLEERTVLPPKNLHSRRSEVSAGDGVNTSTIANFITVSWQI
jgi:hypothetical protein